MKVQKAAPGKYSDGGGLWLHRRSDGGAQWFLRIQIHGRRREMGLGSLDSVGLKEARQEAEKWRSVARQGLDPIKERDRLRRLAFRDDYPLEEVAREAFEARKAELKYDGKAGRWFSPVELHILPKLGRMPVSQIDQNDIKSILAPIWHDKAPTAKKALDRLGIVLRHAAAMGLDVDLQAPSKARALLGKSRHETTHTPALHWKDVPEFYASLNDGSIVHLALRLTILTAVRSSMVRYCSFDEIDEDVWVIPGHRMKSNVEMRVPLSKVALDVISEARSHAKNGFLFPGQRKGVISDATMTRMMERRGMEERPHGFRTSFRTWCAEATDVPREVAETALSHSTGSKVELSYRRTDYLERRKTLMEQWAAFVTGSSSDLIWLNSKRGASSDL